MHDILALASNYRRWGSSMRYAAGLTALLDGTLTGVFVSEPIVPVPAMNMPMAFPEMYTITAEITREARAAEPEFMRWASERGLRQAHWLVAEGYLHQALAHAANWHDLLVLEAGGDSPFSNVGPLGHILLTCGLPCIVVPESFEDDVSLDAIAIAWKGSAESVRALHAALPLLRRARRVVLIEGDSAETFTSVGWNPPLEIDAYLARHGLQVERLRCAADDEASGTELLRMAAEAKVDLLVMGAYGRTRFSEWILGGATRHVLQHSRIPLFMRH